MDWQQIEMKTEQIKQVPDEDLNQSESGAIQSEESKSSIPHSSDTSIVTPHDSVYIKQEPELILETDELPVPTTINELLQKPFDKRAQNTTIDPTKCYICEQSFKDEETLDVHLPAHIDMVPYTCGECTDERGLSLKLTCLSTLHRHFWIHDKAFKCPHCPQRRSTQPSLRQHVKMCHELNAKGKYSCKICGKEWKQKKSLETHQQSHRVQNEDRFVCSYCNKKYRSRAALVDHERGHTDEQPFRCKFCTKTFEFNANRIYHERVHTGEKTFHCNACEKSFRLKKSLRNHMANVHGTLDTKKVDQSIGNNLLSNGSVDPFKKENDTQVGCQEPEPSENSKSNELDSFVSVDVSDVIKQEPETMYDIAEQPSEQGTNCEVTDHDLVTQSQQTDQHKCYICQQLFEDSESHKLHLTVHEDMLPYNCDNCREGNGLTITIISLTHLHDHFQMHSNYMKCSKCLFWASTMELLDAHAAEKHAEKVEGDCICEKCGKHVKKNHIKRHMHAHKLQEEERFSCSLCDVKCSTKGALVSHERRHKKEHPFQCKYCQKRFTIQGILTRHERIHTGEKPYSCEICNKSFGWPNSLTAHREAAHEAQLQQTGSMKVYKCKVQDCGYSTNKGAQLSSHYKKHRCGSSVETV